MGISEFLIAFVLMSGATSASELFIGVSSAIQNVPSLSFGNILGANFLNIVFILSLIAILNGGIKVESKISRRNFWFIVAIAGLPAIFAFDGIISRIEGLILLAVFGIYIVRILSEKIYFAEILNGVKFGSDGFNNFFKNLGLVTAGLIFVVVFSGLLVNSASKVAQLINFTFFSFGVIFVALISTLPELIFGLRAWMLKHPDMVAGNSLGSVAFNSGFIVGLVSVIRPISIAKNGDFFLISFFMILSLVIFNVFIRTKDGISRKEGFILFSFYFIFLAIKFFV
jgi:cation:H+ antiporter